MRTQDFLILEARLFTILGTDDRWIATEAFKIHVHSELRSS